MIERIQNYEQDLQIFTKFNCTVFIIASIIYILFRKLLYKFLDMIFERGLANGYMFLTRVDPRTFKLKALPCIRRTLSGIFLSMFTLSFIMKEDWIFTPSEYLFGYKNVPAHLHFAYIFEFTHYFVSIYFLMADPRSKDFYQMVFHHILSIFLIGFSYYKNFLRYGILVMFVHEICDPFLEIAKVLFYFHYMNIAKTFFILFTIAFTLFRFILFPTFIILPTLYFIYKYCIFGYPIFFIIMLIMLYILNSIWLTFIYSMMSFLIRNGYLENDERSIIEEEK